jgi:cytochrome P450/NADPH-cytochrome P450 reductase
LNYVSSVEEADRIHVAVKPSHGNFHPPKNIENTPVIMFYSGSGIAPFRGFMQERAMQIHAGRSLAPAYIFIGCSHPQKDALLKRTFEDGRMKELSKASTPTRKHKIKERVPPCSRKEMTNVFNDGAKLCICGSSMVGEGVAAMT